MDLRELNHFKVIAECQNLSQASEILFISQPALSRTIQRLEAEIGYSLFERNKGRLILNDNGILLLKYINQINELLGEFKNEIISTNNEKPLIRICLFSATLINLPDFLTSVKEDYECSIKNAVTEQDLLLDHYDIIISDRKMENKKNRNYFFTSEFLLLSVHKTNSLSSKKEITFPELLNQDIGGSIGNNEIHNWAKSLCFEETKKKLKIKHFVAMGEEPVDLLKKYSYFTSSINLQLRYLVKDRVILKVVDKDRKPIKRNLYISYMIENKEKADVLLKVLRSNYTKFFPKRHQDFFMLD